jgi:hypothetical protein
MIVEVTVPLLKVSATEKYVMGAKYSDEDGGEIPSALLREVELNTGTVKVYGKLAEEQDEVVEKKKTTRTTSKRTRTK